MSLGICSSHHSAYVPSYGTGPFINHNNFAPTFGSGPSGPSFAQQGYDQMFMPNPGFGFGSPLMFMMSLLRDMMSMMMGANPHANMPPMGGGCPPYQPEMNYYPSPDSFWSNGNNEGYQGRDGFGGQQGYQNGGTYSQNNQATFGGYSQQAITGGFRSTNDQSHAFGYADQRAFGGNQSLNHQNLNYATGQQLAVTGHEARTNQTAVNSYGTQTASTGHGSRTLQVAQGGAVNQHIDAGSGTRNTQAGGTTQVINAGHNAQNTQAAGNNATQVINTGANSNNFVRAGSDNYQEVNVNGANGSTTFRRDGVNNVSVANLNSQQNQSVTFNQSAGSTNVVNDGSGNDSRSWNSGGTGMTNVYNAGAGNDNLTVRLQNATDNNRFQVDMGAGNDTTRLEGIPRNASQPLSFQGGEGHDTFSLTQDRNGPYTLMRDGKVYQQVGKGGPVINADGYESVRLQDQQGRTIHSSSAIADANRLHAAMRGLGTDERALQQILNDPSKSAEDRQAIAAAYQQRHGQSLRSAIAGDTSGSLERQLLSRL